MPAKCSCGALVDFDVPQITTVAGQFYSITQHRFCSSECLEVRRAEALLAGYEVVLGNEARIDMECWWRKSS